VPLILVKGRLASGTERMVVLAETKETDAKARAELRARILEVATSALGFPPEGRSCLRPLEPC